MSKRLIEIKKKYLEELYIQLAAEFEKMASVTGAQKPRCQQEIDRLEKEIMKVETELEKLEAELEVESEQLKLSAKSYNETLKKWKDNFYKINFKQVGRIFGDILSKFEDKEGAVFFLISINLLDIKAALIEVVDLKNID